MNRRTFFGLFALPFVAKAAPQVQMGWDLGTRDETVIEFWYFGPNAKELRDRIEEAWNKYHASSAT